MGRVFKSKGVTNSEEVELDEFGLEQETINLFEEPVWYKQYLFQIILGVIIVLLLFVRTFFYTFYIISGDSMLPTIENFEIALVDKHTDPSKYQYGDIIIFEGEKDYVKRIIAKGGDTVEIADNKVLINGEVLKEEYLKLDFMIAMDDMDSRKIPKGSYFVLGDNRNVSIDSRNGLGLADFEAIKGKVITNAKIPLSFK